MLLEQLPVRGSVGSRAPNEIRRCESGMLVPCRRRGMIDHAHALPHEPRSEFRVLRYSKSRIEIAGPENCVSSDAQIAGDEERLIPDISSFQVSLWEEKGGSVDEEG